MIPKHLAKYLAHYKFSISNGFYIDYLLVIESTISNGELTQMTFCPLPLLRLFSRNNRLLHYSRFIHLNTYVVPIPLFSRAHIWQGKSTFAS